jgi:Ca-activated chloride channel family protein
MKKILGLWFIMGLCLAWLWGCQTGLPQVDSFAKAEEVLNNNILPKITVTTDIVSDAVAQGYSTENISEPLPPLEKFPLYAAQPNNEPNTVYIEIFGSPDKSNAKKEDESWLVDVAEKFNAENIKVNSGKVIQVGVRNIPSGIGQQFLTVKAAQPAGYTPSNELWLEMLKSDGVKIVSIHSALLPSMTGIAIQNQKKQEIFREGEVSFDQLLDAILAGKLMIGYTNPYSSSTGLNLLYTIFWRAAGHQQNGTPLTVDDLKLPQVNSVFTGFQKQVLLTADTTLDLKEVFLRNPEKLPAFASDYLSYSTLQKLPGFEQSSYIPFGVPHNSPLVGFVWNSPEQQEALKKFAEFATTPAMQQLAPGRTEAVTQYLKRSDLPPIPNGEVLTSVQSFWKQKKDAGQTVYLMTIIDTSGSMDGEPLNAVKEGLRIASKEINPGNYIGLISYGDQPRELVPLAPFDEMQHKRFLAAIDNLRADGATAMYDGMMVGLSKLMEQKKINPDGRFYMLLLTDGQANRGFNFDKVKQIIEYSGVRVYPIAYGDVNQGELDAIAALRESTVKQGTPENVQDLLKGLFQTNL